MSEKPEVYKLTNDFRKRIAKCDQIVMPERSLMDKIINWAQNRDYYIKTDDDDFISTEIKIPLNEGIFIEKFTNNSFYFIVDGELLITTCIFHNKLKVCDVYFNFVTKRIENIQYFVKEKRLATPVDKYTINIEEFEEVVLGCTIETLLIFIYMNEYKDETERLKKKETIIRDQNKSNKKRKKQNVVKIGHVYISDFEDTKKEDLSIKRKIERVTEMWGVRGHWRQLKSGNRTWVKPHVKGNGEIENKTYKLQGDDILQWWEKALAEIQSGEQIETENINMINMLKELAKKHGLDLTNKDDINKIDTILKKINNFKKDEN